MKNKKIYTTPIPTAKEIKEGVEAGLNFLINYKENKEYENKILKEKKNCKNILKRGLKNNKSKDIILKTYYQKIKKIESNKDIEHSEKKELLKELEKIGKEIGIENNNKCLLA